MGLVFLHTQYQMEARRSSIKLQQHPSIHPRIGEEHQKILPGEQATEREILERVRRSALDLIIAARVQWEISIPLAVIARIKLGSLQKNCQVLLSRLGPNYLKINFLSTSFIIIISATAAVSTAEMHSPWRNCRGINTRCCLFCSGNRTILYLDGNYSL